MHESKFRTNDAGLRIFLILPIFFALKHTVADPGIGVGGTFPPLPSPFVPSMPLPCLSSFHAVPLKYS